MRSGLTNVSQPISIQIIFAISISMLLFSKYKYNKFVKTFTVYASFFFFKYEYDLLEGMDSDLLNRISLKVVRASVLTIFYYFIRVKG